MEILFNCKEEVLDYVNQLKNCKLVSINETEREVEVILDIDPKINQELDFQDFTDHFGFDYDDINCIEAYNFCAI